MSKRVRETTGVRNIINIKLCCERLSVLHCFGIRSLGFRFRKHRIAFLVNVWSIIVCLKFLLSSVAGVQITRKPDDRAILLNGYDPGSNSLRLNVYTLAEVHRIYKQRRGQVILRTSYMKMVVLLP